MTQIRALIENNAGCVRGTYRSRHPQQKTTRDGRSFIEMTVEDMSGRLPAYLWDVNGEVETQLKDLQCVDIVGSLRKRRDGLALDLNRIQIAQSQASEVVRLIPESFCPVPWQLCFLEALVSSLSITSIQTFTQNVLGDDGLAFMFVSAPASLRHHHNYPGGLLQHSLECAQMVSRQTHFSTEQRELGMVSALFHDVGKILTITNNMRRTSLGKTLDHDKLTLEVLAPYLRQLDEDWPEGGAELRYLLTWRKGKWDSAIPRWAVAEMVNSADRISTGLAVGH